MTRTITVSDETYERLERLAKEAHQTPEQLLADELGYAEFWKGGRLISRQVFKKNPNEGDIILILRGLGLDDEEIAHLQAIPLERRAAEILVLLRDLVDKGLGRDPLTAPRYLTFEQFFRELGETDEAIEEAKRRGAERANL